MTTSRADTAAAVEYPDALEDEEPDESEIHGLVVGDSTETLIDFFADRPDVYVWKHMFVYYEEGNPAAVVAPDVFVVFGVPKEVEPKRRVFQVWKEGRPPTVAFEITSATTKDNDTQRKPEVYARIGVTEYFLFDPLAEYLNPPFQGYRLVGERYERIPPEADGALVSAALGLRLRAEGWRLRFVNPATGAYLLTPRERAAAVTARLAAEAARADAEAARAAAAIARAEAAERRIAELEARLREREAP